MSEKFPAALIEGTVLAGQYIVNKPLGQGGFGITYLADDHKTGSKVVIKEFYPETMVSRSQQTIVVPFAGEREENFSYGKGTFLQEAETLHELADNPNVVKVYRYFEENGTAYFVMEYVEGESLDAYIKNNGGRLSYEEAERCLLPVIRALGAVHKKGIIHRDVTPDNIYLGKDGSVKILDFGAARYSLGDKSRSLDVVLKHGFAPKEQYTRHGRQGPYTDIYSVAASFYFCLTGRRPPDSIDRIENDELIPPSRLGASLPGYKEMAILKALSVQPKDRFQSMDEFADALMNSAFVFNPGGNNQGPVNQRFYDQQNPGGYPNPGQMGQNAMNPGQGQMEYNQMNPGQGQMGYNQVNPGQGQMGYNQMNPGQIQRQPNVHQAGGTNQGQFGAVDGNTNGSGNSSSNNNKTLKYIIIGIVAAAVVFIGLGIFAVTKIADSKQKAERDRRAEERIERNNVEDDDGNDTDPSEEDLPVASPSDIVPIAPASPIDTTPAVDTYDAGTFDANKCSNCSNRTVFAQKGNMIFESLFYDGLYYSESLNGDYKLIKKADLASCLNAGDDYLYFVDTSRAYKMDYSTLQCTEIMTNVDGITCLWVNKEETGAFFATSNSNDNGEYKIAYYSFIDNRVIERDDPIYVEDYCQVAISDKYLMYVAGSSTRAAVMAIPVDSFNDAPKEMIYSKVADQRYKSIACDGSNIYIASSLGCIVVGYNYGSSVVDMTISDDVGDNGLYFNVQNGKVLISEVDWDNESSQMWLLDINSSNKTAKKVDYFEGFEIYFVSSFINDEWLLGGYSSLDDSSDQPFFYKIYEVED